MKWPWKRDETPLELDSEGLEPLEPELIEQRPGADTPLAVKVSQLEGELAGIRLEWAEVLDKINRWASRQAARERQRAVRELGNLAEAPETHEDAPGPTNGGESGSMADRASAKAQLRARAAQILGRR